MPLEFFLNAFATLFVTIDPIGLAPIFLAVTAGAAPKARRTIAVRSCVIAIIVLMLFAIAGDNVLNLLGISISAFRIAGGMLLFWTAFEMVFEKRQQRKSATAERAAVDQGAVQDLAVFPLAIPLISGPGSISASVLLASQAPDLFALGGFLALILLVVALVFVVFLIADRLDRYITETARAVLTRLLGVLLAALAVQFIADGVRALAA